MEDELYKSKMLNKEQLASINARDIIKLQNEDDKLNEQEIKSKAEMADNFYRNNFEKVLKLMLFRQLEFLGKQAETQGQILFGRGTINGLSLIDEWFKEQSGIIHPDEKEDEQDSIPSVG